MRLLDNHGWGLNTMIVFIVILILIVLVVSVLMYNFGIGKDSSNLVVNDFIVIAKSCK